MANIFQSKSEIKKFKIVLEIEDPEYDYPSKEQYKIFWEKEALVDGLDNYSIEFKIIDIQEIQPATETKS